MPLSTSIFNFLWSSCVTYFIVVYELSNEDVIIYKNSVNRAVCKNLGNNFRQTVLQYTFLAYLFAHFIYLIKRTQLFFCVIWGIFSFISMYFPTIKKKRVKVYSNVFMKLWVYYIYNRLVYFIVWNNPFRQSRNTNCKPRIMQFPQAVVNVPFFVFLFCFVLFCFAEK